ncbi:MAG: hypothetical protein KJZ93_03725 [Caldilineaceae bacterium]|nr:hypothetical protein [Caldilineaceae bacterium]
MTPPPAVVIGGPPNSGKSVLTYHLSQLLRHQGVDHYVLRACPDGGGDWFQEAPPQVRELRAKGEFSQPFVELVCRDLAGRGLPLLVDAGGRPLPEQEIIFDQCTHAILLASTDEGLAEWRALAQRHHLTVLAEVRSTLDEDDRVAERSPVLRGRIGGLVRHQPVDGPMLQALAGRLAHLFADTGGAPRTLHLDRAPVTQVVEIDRFGRSLGLVGEEEIRWEPADLPPLLAQLSPAQSLAVYGRAPVWVYVALALHTAPQPFHQYDARLGWVEPPPLCFAAVDRAGPLQYSFTPLPGGHLLTVQLDKANQYLDYDKMIGVATPPAPAPGGLVLSGPLPYWLMVGLARAYRPFVTWLAVDYPPLAQAIVVAADRKGVYQPGDRAPRRMNAD